MKKLFFTFLVFGNLQSAILKIRATEKTISKNILTNIVGSIKNNKLISTALLTSCVILYKIFVKKKDCGITDLSVLQDT